MSPDIRSGASIRSNGNKGVIMPIFCGRIYTFPFHRDPITGRFALFGSNFRRNRKGDPDVLSPDTLSGGSMCSNGNKGVGSRAILSYTIYTFFFFQILKHGFPIFSGPTFT